MPRNICWEGFERVPGTKPYTKGSCRKKSSTRRSTTRKSRARRAATTTRKSRKRRSPVRKSRKRRFNFNSGNYGYAAGRSCTPGSRKKFAKMVDGKCIRFGDPNMTIKKHIPGRKKSFCARHRCSQKRDRATPGYQSCLKWNCKMRGSRYNYAMVNNIDRLRLFHYNDRLKLTEKGHYYYRRLFRFIAEDINDYIKESGYPDDNPNENYSQMQNYLEPMRWLVNRTGPNDDILLGDILKNTHGVLVEDINITGFSHPIELDIARKFELLFKPFYRDFQVDDRSMYERSSAMIGQEISINQHIGFMTTMGDWTIDQNRWNEMFIFNGVLEHAIAENLIQLIPSRPDNKLNPTIDRVIYMSPSEREDLHRWEQEQLERPLSPLTPESDSIDIDLPDGNNDVAGRLFDFL